MLYAYLNDYGQKAIHSERITDSIGNEVLFTVQEQKLPLTSNFNVVHPDGIAPKKSDIIVAKELLIEMGKALTDDQNELNNIISLKVERSFVYFDISDFSEHPAGQQALIINSISALMHKDLWLKSGGSEYFSSIEASLCIGDGYIFVHRGPIFATCFAARLACMIEHYIAQKTVPVEFHFRASVHVGAVYRFFDFGREKWNYVGDGINGGQRILAAMGKDIDDVIYVSDEIKRRLIQKRGYAGGGEPLLHELTNKGRHRDKHGKLWRVYQLNHQSIANLVL